MTLLTQIQLIYYRLKQVDFNGQIGYSEVIPIHIKTNTEVNNSFTIINVGSSVTLQFSMQPTAETKIHVIDALGRLSKLIDLKNVKIDDAITIDTKGLNKGWYLIGVVGPTSSEFQKITF